MVRVVRGCVCGCVCGSDLWYYRGINKHRAGGIGHKFIGVVEEIGSAVTALHVGDLVIAPFTFQRRDPPGLRRGIPGQLLPRRLVRRRHPRRRAAPATPSRSSVKVWSGCPRSRARSCWARPGSSPPRRACRSAQGTGTRLKGTGARPENQRASVA
ncbi:alcohol dehydrogenase catalytic domain-containing protein [Tessaracoccus lacteus]|uniref:alcohol dehydrogenase catalytic domain-containing protein n=1 Tax=Tessaracoccus lacteus TaxID=3041766 RepID=UPI0034DB0999